MPSAKLTALVNLAAGQAPDDLAYIVDVSAGAAGSKKSTLNDFISVITRNITDGALRFQGFAAPAVSAAGQGSIFFATATNTFRGSRNASAYENLLFGNGVATQFAVFDAVVDRINPLANSSSVFGTGDAKLHRLAIGNAVVSEAFRLLVRQDVNAEITCRIEGPAAATARLQEWAQIVSGGAATVTEQFRTDYGTTGGASDGFGFSHLIRMETQTVALREAIQWSYVWTSATLDLARTSRLDLALTNVAAFPFNSISFRPNQIIVHDNSLVNVPTSGIRQYCFLGQNDQVLGTFSTTSYLATFNASTITPSISMLVKGRGTNSTPLPINNGDQIGALSYWGYHTAGNINNIGEGANITAVARENWAAGARACEMQFSTVRAGTTIINYVGKWSPNGTFQIGINQGTDSLDNKLLVGAGGYIHDLDTTASIVSEVSDVHVLEIVGDATIDATHHLIRGFLESDGFSGADRFRFTRFGVLEQRAGRSLGEFTRSEGVYDTQTQDASNSGTGETNLHQRTVAANVLDNADDYLECTVSGFTAANGNAKQIRIYFGNTATPTLIFDSTSQTFNNEDWVARIYIIRITDTTVRIILTWETTGSINQRTYVNTASSACDSLGSLANIFRVTGQGGASADITQNWTTIVRSYAN